MTPTPDYAASVRQRLLDRARREGRPFSELVQYYATERFLSRLAMSEYAGRFVLKGAMLLSAWGAPGCRPTMDVDLLGITSNDAVAVSRQIAGICTVDASPDGIVFYPETIIMEAITEDAAYEGLRVRFRAKLGKMRIHMQIDLGFGDVVYPSAMEVRFPTILDLPSPCLLGYSRESVIAEKLHAMVRHGDLNSRMKDFYDVWHLSRNYEFMGTVLGNAIQLTFQNRGLSATTDIASFREEFIINKQPVWSAFLRRNPNLPAPGKFGDLVSELAAFTVPVLRRLHENAQEEMHWAPPGPWTSGEVQKI